MCLRVLRGAACAPAAAKIGPIVLSEAEGTSSRLIDALEILFTFAHRHCVRVMGLGEEENETIAFRNWSAGIYYGTVYKATSQGELPGWRDPLSSSHAWLPGLGFDALAAARLPSLATSPPTLTGVRAFASPQASPT